MKNLVKAMKEAKNAFGEVMKDAKVRKMYEADVEKVEYIAGVINEQFPPEDYADGLDRFTDAEIFKAIALRALELKYGICHCCDDDDDDDEAVDEVEGCCENVTFEFDDDGSITVAEEYHE